MGFNIDRLEESELSAFREFCELNWGEKHPLIHNDEMFSFYYRRGELINFVRAIDEETGEIRSVAGFILANESETPDIWISYVLSKKGASLNLGLKLIEYIKTITNARSLGVNNIRKKIFGFYGFLGYTAGTVGHYYRLNPERAGSYQLCRVKDEEALPITRGDAEFFQINTEKELDCFGFEAYCQLKPFKDRRYVEHRFFENPWLNYEVFGAARNGVTFALFVLRTLEHEGYSVLRLVDFIGERQEFYLLGELLDKLARERGADFSDAYGFGIDDALFEKAGFTKRKADDENIIPDYLQPPLFENVDFYAVSDGSDYWVLRADGDQDRPNLAAIL